MSALYGNNVFNLVLGGGGIKGIAYAGVFSEAEKRGYQWGNIAGVSAGALAGAYLAAGYNSYELAGILSKFDFSKIDITTISDRLPAIRKYNEIKEVLSRYSRNLKQQILLHSEHHQEINLDFYRANLIKTLITYYKNGYLFDGDYLEEWIYNMLLQRGIKTFGDLRYGIPDSVNPNGYKIRMTAVDANRGKVIVLPDDLTFYGINPDAFEVAKAVRMSTCVPFVFKPVELRKTVNNKTKVYNIVDGGVLDKLPYWLIDTTQAYPRTVCFTLDGGGKKSFLNTSVDMLKDLIASVQGIGGPKATYDNIPYVGKIDTSKVGFLDFNLSEDEKLYLYKSGESTAINVFNSLANLNVEKEEQSFEHDRKQKFNYCSEQLASILILFILLYLIKG